MQRAEDRDLDPGAGLFVAGAVTEADLRRDALSIKCIGRDGARAAPTVLETVERERRTTQRFELELVHADQ